LLGRVPKLFGVIFIAFAVLLWLLMIRSLLLLLWRQKRLPQFAGTLLFSDFDLILQNAFRWFVAKSKSLGVRFVYWGIGLMVLTQSLVWSGFFAESDFKLANYFVPWVTRDLGKEPAAIALEVDFDDARREDSTTIISIVEQLTIAGARAIVVDRSLVQFRLGKKIAQSGIVVFGSRAGVHYFVADEITEAYYTLDHFRRPIGAIHALVPYLGTYDADVILETIRKVRGIPERDRIRKAGNAVVFGDYSIPVGRDGILYVDLNSERYPENEFVAPVSVVPDRWTGLLRLWHRYEGPKSASGLPLAEEYGSYFRGKVVFVMRGLSRPPASPSSYGYGEIYAKAFECVLDRDYLVRSNWLHLGLSVVLLLLSGLICRLLRPMYAFPLLIVVAAGSFLTGHWLFHVHRLFIEISAFVVTISLAAIIFPAVRFAHENRESGENTIESSGDQTIEPLANDSMDR
jgi:hypothetical protein